MKKIDAAELHRGVLAETIKTIPAGESDRGDMILRNIDTFAAVVTMALVEAERCQSAPMEGVAALMGSFVASAFTNLICSVGSGDSEDADKDMAHKFLHMFVNAVDNDLHTMWANRFGLTSAPDELTRGADMPIPMKDVGDA